jgi:hypothetical protein
MPLAFADVTGGARYPPALSREGKLELTEESRLARLPRSCRLFGVFRVFWFLVALVSLLR